MAVRILDPTATEEVKVVSNTQVPIEGLPIWLMGPPVSESDLAKWCHANVDKLDKAAVTTALSSSLDEDCKEARI